MTIPSSLIYFFSAIGLISFTKLAYICVEYSVHYLKFKRLPMSKEEETICLLRQNIEQQNAKIQNLEKETEKMTMALLKHLS